MIRYAMIAQSAWRRWNRAAPAPADASVAFYYRGDRAPADMHASLTSAALGAERSASPRAFFCVSSSCERHG